MIEIKFIFETMEEAMEFLNSKKEQQTKPKKRKRWERKEHENVSHESKIIQNRTSE